MRELTEQEMTEIYQSHLVEDFPAGEVKPLAHMLAVSYTHLTLPTKLEV